MLKAAHSTPSPHFGTDRGNPLFEVQLIALIVDAGPLFAYIDRDDHHHHSCLELLETHPGPLLVPMLVITEVANLLATRLSVDAEVRFLADLAEGNLIAEPVVASDWLRIAELVAQYQDLPLGTAVASVVAAAERLDVSELATLGGDISPSFAPRQVHSHSCRDPLIRPSRGSRGFDTII